MNGAIAFGDEHGRVFLVEERYENRFDQEGDQPEGPVKDKNIMMERLRRLRE
jgi:hypothetical protein